MRQLAIVFIMALSIWQVRGQSFEPIAADNWNHTAEGAEGMALNGTDTLYTGELLYRASQLKVDLKNDDKVGQSLTLEVIYDDLLTEQHALNIAEGEKKASIKVRLNKSDYRNVAQLRIYPAEGNANVTIEGVSAEREGVAENMDNSKLGKATVSVDDYAPYKVIRVPYPVAKPPFFMGINSKKVTITAYKLDDEPATLKVNCIDQDKEWRKEFTFEVTTQPKTYTFEIDENLETEYEGYFMILMPTAESSDIVIRKVVAE